MLNKLTKKQIELQSVVRDEWINLALHEQKFDKEEIEAGVKWLYYASNFEEPKVVIVESPKDLAKKFSASVWASVRDSVGDSVGDSVRASVGDSVRASVWASVRDSVRASVGDSVRASVWASVRDSVRASVGDSVRDSVRDSVGDSVGDSVRDSVRASVWDSVSYACLSGDADDASWMNYWQRIGIYKDKDSKLKNYLGYLRSGAYYVLFFEKVAFVMIRPTLVKQNERKQLHSTDSPALAWKDGTEEYYLQGIKFEKKWWDKIVNDKMSAKEVLAIDNTEHRRIAYEMMDKTKMKKLKGYKVLDEVKDDGYGYGMKIISFKLPEIGTIKYLNCFCPTTGREYFLGTDEVTCWQAKAKSFSFNSDELKFINEW